MPIRKLPDTLANQIAAGEVIERPSSVLKELTENALDAGATMLRVDLTDSGLTKLAVTDNGSGIPQAELALALQRHATSKIATTEDLFNIHTFGFRGEALPSIASVSRFTLTSRPAGQPEAWSISGEGGLKPAAHPPGTRVEVADLFYATPARRKFLKSPRAERTATEGVIKNLALAHPHLTLTVVEDGTETWHIPAAQGNFLSALHPRLANVVGEDFARAALPVNASRSLDESRITNNESRLEGYISPAQLHAGTAQKQFLFVNGRPIKDRSLQAALKNAYGDALPAGRHPFAVLFLTVPADQVDVNVHPAKSEVRFRDANGLYGLIYAAIRQTLAQHRAPGVLAQAPGGMMGQAWNKPGTPITHPGPPATFSASFDLQTPPQKLWKGEAPTNHESPITNHESPNSHPLGSAVGQIAATYIVAETPEGALILVDQHAAHERLVYEGLKSQFTAGHITAQQLLIPAIVTLSPAQVQTLLAHAAELQTFGLEVESYSPTAVAVTAMPQLIGGANPAPLIQDLVEDLQSLTARTTLSQKLEHVLATIACHHSIRAHRRLSLAEQNALLRQMEATPNSLTCNHGRPTVVSLTLPELEKLFARR
ncbi:MAG: DNA mismatch repair endonuclease MutL [Proteobacteria bacterium]|nr:DNA mismatch repair endonuclease MutL [Pseudomonadota bacterium]